MKYISTRGKVPPLSFRDAVMTGLARDGGLLLPASIPDVSNRLGAWRDLDYCSLAFEVMRLFCDLSEEDLRDIIRRSYVSFDDREVAPLIQVNDIFILELFHGPTLAFKDIALQFLGNLFEYLLEERDEQMNILVATSGDTGSAAIHAVRGMDRIRIFVMHPSGRVSEMQERQMTSVLDANVFNLAVEGTFDDCQRIMKNIFNDLPFKDRYSLGSVNSINWARLLAQIVYYFYGCFRAIDATGSARVSFSVPTGNFGDIFAGWIATKMGLPVDRLILATNENDILSRFFLSGEYSVGPVRPTLSPSMDIQVASNFERYLYYRVGENADDLTGLMSCFEATGRLTVPVEDGVPVENLIQPGMANRDDTLRTIREYYEKCSYALDPHTAVGVSVGRQHHARDVPLVCLATAHPAKFAGAVNNAVGSNAAQHPILDALSNCKTRCERAPADVDSIRRFIESKQMDDSRCG